MLICLAVHRLVYADNIIVLDESGRILHQGSFEQLQTNTEYFHGLGIEQNNSTKVSGDMTSSPARSGPAGPQLPHPDKAAESKGQVLGELAVYGYYFGSVPAWYTVLFCLLIILYGGSFKMTELLLSYWTGQINANASTNNFYLGLYSMLCGLALLGITGGAYFYLVYMVPLSSEVLHARLLEAVINAPLSFFSKTDVGVTTNRFSQDMSVIDTELPFALIDLVINLATMLMGAILMCVFSGYFAAVLFPVIICCWGELTYHTILEKHGVDIDF